MANEVVRTAKIVSEETFRSHVWPAIRPFFGQNARLVLLGDLERCGGKIQMWALALDRQCCIDGFFYADDRPPEPIGFRVQYVDDGDPQYDTFTLSVGDDRHDRELDIYRRQIATHGLAPYIIIHAYVDVVERRLVHCVWAPMIVLVHLCTNDYIRSHTKENRRKRRPFIYVPYRDVEEFIAVRVKDDAVQSWLHQRCGRYSAGS